MVFRRRCMKLGIRQRLFLVFVFAVFVLFKMSRNADRKKSKAGLLSGEEAHNKFPNDHDHELNIMDREMALLEPYMNDRMNDNDQANDFEQSRAHIGHSLLSETILTQIRNALLKMSPHLSPTIPDIEDFIVDISEMLQYSDAKSKLSCKDVDNISIDQEMDAPSKKLVYKGLHNNNEVTVKAPWKDLAAKTRCLQKFDNLDRCTAEMNFQVLREILLHSVLHQANIVKMVGYCIRGDAVQNIISGNGVILVTELGLHCYPQLLARLNWKKRLQLIQSFAKLLVYLESSPLGSLRMMKVTTKDFVCVKDTPKLVDLDELRMGELTCTTRKDCYYSGLDIGIQCMSGLCKGYNAKSNMKKVYDVFIPTLLRAMPDELSADASMIKDDCEHLRMTPEVLLNTVKRMSTIKVAPEETMEDDLDSMRKRPEDRHIQPQLEFGEATSHTYRRMNMSNLPGMYDFTCAESRVTWGCVYDAQGLEDAEKKCNAMSHCKAFVAFSKFPEVRKLFTVVLKSSFDSVPVVQEGVTLFIKERSAVYGNQANQGEINVVKMQAKVEDNFDQPDNEIKNEALEERRQCTQSLYRDQKKLRRSAEKRLMTHLGMKGLDEKTWLNEVKSGDISGSYPLISTDGEFMVTFDTERVNGVDRAVVMTQTGPAQHYLAQSLAFFIDRLLGLYHVPPTALVQMPTRSLTTAWDEPWFKPYKQHINNGYLSAVLTVPKPRAITAQDVILPRPESYVREIVSFSKKQRIQLEYLIVMWLTRMPHPAAGHVGYKGHLIHYESSQGFLNLSQSWILNYFYNCQFPKAVAQILGCFRCVEGTKKVNRICTLGQEVLGLVWTGELSNVKAKVADKTARELETIINNAASRLLAVMDKCARLFSKEAVLY